MRRASPCRDPEYWAHSAKEFWLNPRQSSLLGLKIVWAKEANRNCRLRHQFQVRICLDSIFIRWTSILRSSWDSLKESQDCKAQSSNLNLNDKCCQSEKYFRICTIFLQMITIKLTMDWVFSLWRYPPEGWDELLQDIDFFQPRKGSDAVDLLQMVAGWKSVWENVL